jgi:uncharacterized damage-inducible protein DinB
MARYNRWMNEKVYASASLLTDEERKRDRGAFFASIHGTLNHLLVGDRVWLARLTGVAAPPGMMAPGIASLDQELHADFDTLRAERARTDDAIDAWARSIDDAALGGDVRYARRGQERAHPLWWAAMQMLNHGTHHRGQVTTLLFQAGRDPGATDLLAMLLEESAAR